MRLKSIDYAQLQGTDREWMLEGLTLGQMNLIVGKNATGKTRVLNVINGLGKLVSGRQKPSELTTGAYRTTFEHEGRLLHYTLDIHERKVVTEEFRDGERTLLRRAVGGVGEIFHEKEKKMQEFQTPETEAAVVARRDTIQHRFLEPLGEWGGRVRHYEFGDKMGRGHIALLVKGALEPDPTDVNAVIALFRKGVKDFPDRFAESVKNDMNRIGYLIEQVGVMAPTDVTVPIPLGAPLEPLILFVKERDLPCLTQQTDMSQGMFRALSVIIHLNYATIAMLPSAVLVDDIGEGLDFERSCKLIDLLRDRAHDTMVQLILSTNDRFVMNEVPLAEWSILRRKAGHVRVLNQENSGAMFEEFRFTGLSNFSLFEMDFAGDPAVEEAVAHE
ncbi:MAG: ATP-binding protein [Gemmataceae bacterium]|nr:ATP-binding protein [Gemmataceae bacterium]